nr:MAG TPA: hypothetical protein [Caudoviricetes sp.]
MINTKIYPVADGQGCYRVLRQGIQILGLASAGLFRFCARPINSS